MGKRTNESKLKNILGESLGKAVSFGKKESDHQYISVDFTYTDEDGILYLIEVESDNKAKIEVGEYILLDLLFDQPNENNGSKNKLKDKDIGKCCFLTIVCHAQNTPERINKVLGAVKDKYKLKLSYKSIKLSDIHDLDSFKKLIKD